MFPMVALLGFQESIHFNRQIITASIKLKSPQEMKTLHHRRCIFMTSWQHFCLPQWRSLVCLHRNPFPWTKPKQIESASPLKATVYASTRRVHPRRERSKHTSKTRTGRPLSFSGYLWAFALWVYLLKQNLGQMKVSRGDMGWREGHSVSFCTRQTMGLVRRLIGAKQRGITRGLQGTKLRHDYKWSKHFRSVIE